MESQIPPSLIRRASHYSEETFGDHGSDDIAEGPAIVSKSSRAQTDSHGRQDPSKYSPAVSYSPSQPDSYLPKDSGCSGQDYAYESPLAASLSESTPSATSTVPSTGTASNTHTTASSPSPPESIFQDDDLDGESCAVETRQQSGLTSAPELIEICQGTFVAVTKEPDNEDKLQWRALSKRIHMALAKTCRRYPNLSLQFKLAGGSGGHLQPTILFVCPPETQKQVRKFVKKHKWLSERECGYKNLIIDGNFLRVALDGERGLEGGLFIHTDMGDAQTLCAKLGRLEGVLNPNGASSRFTIGGVVVVNDTLCCLTTGHVLFDGPDASEIPSSSDEEETDEEDGHSYAADTGIAQRPLEARPFSRPSFDPQQPNSDEDAETRSHLEKETRIGRLLTTSNWKRGVFASNEDWSLIRLDPACCSEEWIVNKFQDRGPRTETHDTIQITVDKLARTEAEMSETEVIILAGCTGLQNGRLSTTAVQLYLDNATFEARELVTHEPLSKSDVQIKF